MAKFYANENFRRPVVKALQNLGHDVLTTLEAGNANQGISDEEVLEFAKAKNRIVLTFNRKHFIRLHRHNPNHAGIMVCTEDKDPVALANRIQDAILEQGEVFDNQLVRINRPHSNSQ
jgi:Domain of unknown function (DUF5615)